MAVTLGFRLLMIFLFASPTMLETIFLNMAGLIIAD
jgi:hypothetical protein